MSLIKIIGVFNEHYKSHRLFSSHKPVNRININNRIGVNDLNGCVTSKLARYLNFNIILLYTRLTKLHY